MTAAAPAPPLSPTSEPWSLRRIRTSQVPEVTRRAQARLGVLLVMPLLLMVGVFLLFPVADAVYYVFVDFNGIDPTPAWAGFDNFTELAQDPDVWAALRNNVIWIVLGTTRLSCWGSLSRCCCGACGAGASPTGSRSSSRSCCRRS